MADPAPAADPAAAVGWTCPFCALLCDEFALAGDGPSAELRGSTCPRARASLAAHAQRPPGPAQALVDGGESGVDEAVREAARR